MGGWQFHQLSAKDGKEVDSWCVKFDIKEDRPQNIYVTAGAKGCKEDVDFEELEAAIELSKEHEEENK